MNRNFHSHSWVFVGSVYQPLTQESEPALLPDPMEWQKSSLGSSWNPFTSLFFPCRKEICSPLQCWPGKIKESERDYRSWCCSHFHRRGCAGVSVGCIILSNWCINLMLMRELDAMRETTADVLSVSPLSERSRSSPSSLICSGEGRTLKTSKRQLMSLSQRPLPSSTPFPASAVPTLSYLVLLRAGITSFWEALWVGFDIGMKLVWGCPLGCGPFFWYGLWAGSEMNLYSRLPAGNQWATLRLQLTDSTYNYSTTTVSSFKNAICKYRF